MSQLTAETIRRIAGRLDEGRILEILKTGAEEADLIEAFEWLYAKPRCGPMSVKS
jgi:hypothetical protein